MAQTEPLPILAGMSPRLVATITFANLLLGVGFNRVRRGPGVNWAKTNFTDWKRQGAVILDRYQPFRTVVGNPAVIGIETAMRFDPETEPDTGADIDWIWEKTILAVDLATTAVNPITGLPVFLKIERSGVDVIEWADDGRGLFGIALAVPVDI